MLRISTVCVVLLGLTAPAFAQQYDQYGQPYDPNAQVIVTDPNAPPQQVQYVEQEEVTAEQGRGLQYGASLYVPIWLGDTVLNEAFLPGIGIAGRIGWELGGGLSFELGGGISWNPTRPEFEELSMYNFFIDVGARYALLNPSRFVPFFQAGVGVNLWNLCDDFGCSDYDPTFGFFGGAGAIYEINMNAALELGVNFNLSSAGNVFDEAQLGIAPFIGLTLYY